LARASGFGFWCRPHARLGCSRSRAVNRREPDLIAERRVRPNLAGRNLQVRTKPLRAVDCRHRYVEVEVDLQLPKRHPLRHRLEMVDRLGGLDLDYADELLRFLVGVQDKVRKPWRGWRPDRSRLLVTRVDGDVELPLVFGLEKANYPVVLELLAHGTHEDRAQ